MVLTRLWVNELIRQHNFLCCLSLILLFLIFGYFDIIFVWLVMHMKYNEISLNEKIFGEGFIIYDWEESDEKIVIYVKATSHDDVCPVCGSPTSSLHNTYHRMIQAYPVRNKTTFIDVIAYKYDCTDVCCNRKVIMQNLPFVSPSQRRTDDLNCLILAV